MPSGHPKAGRLRPLSATAIDTLRQINETPMPCFHVNPGVSSRLLREGLIAQRVTCGRAPDFHITQAGIDRLNELEPTP